MDKHIQWITHKGKRILFSNYAGLKEEECLEAMEETMQELLRQPPDHTVLTLTDVSNSVASPAIIKKAKELTAATKERGGTGLASTVGMTGMKRALAQVVSKDVHFADSIEEAKDWLVEQVAK